MVNASGYSLKQKPRSNEQGFYHIYSKTSGIVYLPDIH